MTALSFLARFRATSAAAAPEAPAAPVACLNCGDATPGSYCPSCGQARRTVVISLREMLVDFLDDQLSLSSRLPRTTAILLTRPGFLTEEYLRGRIARYIRPLRLYLGASVLFFLLLSVVDGAWPELKVGDETAPAAPAVPDVPADLPADLPVDPATRARLVEAQERAAGVREMAGRMEAAAPANSWVDGLTFETENPALQRLIEERKDHFRGMTRTEALREVGNAFREHVPTMMFLLLPVYALLLKLLYVRRRRLYVEHFVFALHAHAFAFAIFTLLLLLPAALPAELLLFWIPLYVFLAMRRVYRQPLLKTGVKYLALGGAYSVVLVFAVAATAVLTLLLV